MRHSGSPNIDPYHSEGELRVQLGTVGSLSCKIYNVANRWEREKLVINEKRGFDDGGKV